MSAKVLIVLSLLIGIQTKRVVLPFEKFIDTSTWNENNIFERLTHNMASVELSIGGKTARLNIESDMYFSYLAIQHSVDYTGHNVTTFDCNGSEGCTLEGNRYNIYNDDMDYSDSAKMKVNKGDEKLIQNYEILIPQKIKETSGLYANSGKLGLGLNFDKSYNIPETTGFLNSLKTSDSIDLKYYFFEYTDLKKGKGNLVIGELPYEYNSNKYKEKNFEETHIYKEGEYDKWIFSITKFLYDNKHIDNRTFTIKNAKLKFDFGMLQAPQSFIQCVNSTFINEINSKQCQFKEVNNYIYFFCNKTVSMNLKKLTFVNDNTGYSFDINNDDIWYNYEGNKYLLIRFEKKESDTEDNWILGEPFLKKYTVVFDMEKKKMHIMNPNIEEERSKTMDIILFVVICLGCLLVIIYTFYIVFKPYLSKKSSKKIESEGLTGAKANEDE